MMKKILSIFACLLMAVAVHAQDVIVRTDGSTILAKVQKVTKNEVEYKKHSNPTGPTYTIAIAEITAINYETGEKDTFSSPAPAAPVQSPATTHQTNTANQPYKTNETASQFSNDKQLLSVYSNYTADEFRKKAKIWKLTGIIGGSVLAVGGIVGYYVSFQGGGDSILGFVVAGIGVAGGLTCYLIGNHYSNIANRYSINSASVWQYNIETGNGKSIALGMNLLSSNNYREKALGIGLRYNF